MPTVSIIKHKVELQERLVRRLKIVEQFQGAYYELVVANILIRAGFELTREDEADGKTKHCEYAAVSKRTGKKYWVEAKMRSVAGLLGKTQRDGTTDMNPLNRLIPQLNDALVKPAADERLIFIDLNTEQIMDAAGKPPWIENAARRLEQYEKRKLAPGLTAHLFVTNFAFHRFLNDQMPLAAFPFGLGLPDLNRPGHHAPRIRGVSPEAKIYRHAPYRGGDLILRPLPNHIRRQSSIRGTSRPLR